jgi:hypothetical protein
VALTKSDIEGLNFALEEAQLVGVEVDARNRKAGVTLVILWDPESGPPPDDLRSQLVLEPVGRVVASLRHGSWDDRKAAVEPLEIRDLPRVFKRLRGDQSVYGYRFFDVAAEERGRKAKDSWFVREAGRFSLATASRETRSADWTSVSGSTACGSIGPAEGGSQSTSSLPVSDDGGVLGRRRGSGQGRGKRTR